jgi:hypothetical protein
VLHTHIVVPISCYRAFCGNSVSVCDISSSHGGEYEGQNLLGRIASESSVDIQLRTRQYIPEDSELQFQHDCGVKSGRK